MSPGCLAVRCPEIGPITETTVLTLFLLLLVSMVRCYLHWRRLYHENLDERKPSATSQHVSSIMLTLYRMRPEPNSNIVD